MQKPPSETGPAPNGVRAAGAVRTSAGVLTPLSTAHVRITGGLLRRWQDRNRAATAPHVIRQLRAAGNLDNLRGAADRSGDGGSDDTESANSRTYQGSYPFLDTDVYKTLEGLAYELARDGGPTASTAGTDDADRVEDADGTDGPLRAFYEESVALIERAQAEDGYLNSYYQHPGTPGEPWSDLAWGHELYNLGHLVQAAVAANRQLGDGRLLAVAVRFADLVVRLFGPEGKAEVCGHPEVEMALVELYRETGEAAYLRQAQLFVDRRGHGTVRYSHFPPEYFQDHVPLRDLPSVTGHAVRMVYLAAGAADVALEYADPTLLGPLRRLWHDMVASKLYLTGGLGARHSDEAIGDRYELPSERAYSESCAAIGTMQWAWRMFLATEETGYLDVFERVLYNAFAVGLSADGTEFFYDNPLQRRTDHEQRSGAEAGGELLRRSWFRCPCCPPNVVRWIAQLADYIALERPGRLLLALYADARVETESVALTVRTEYPWEDEVRVGIERAPDAPYRIDLRVPGWTCGRVRATVNGAPVEEEVRDDVLSVRRRWRAGDELRLVLPMPARLHGSHPSLDATRGAAALCRGPLVYCLEQHDAPVDMERLLLRPEALAGARVRQDGPALPGEPESVALELPLTVSAAPGDELYPSLATLQAHTSAPAEEPSVEEAAFIPYFLWGNREAAAMRVWIRRW
ncbi:glycoside hydrolase family 127 protein [Streptomyces iconiensis]|uniref:Glycoside hydrolase family 127 protein n=1 Tax=Streptomyces iconiensis TaxID=1384038 RepID=A0ABT7A1J7_9ACTN|nr:beta-L-arabinofuranosidase domain-containing protein [Streptomyces iconiensis]MDJ1134934.1 glycoside hydrolase family 127 protein [Streptomyces iconiensis]